MNDDTPQQVNKQKILLKAKAYFKEVIAPNHIKNLKKLTTLKKFAYNPFLLDYLSKFLTGKDDAKSIAKVLIYPRILGTSITTSFGQNIQFFCSKVLSGFGSVIPGIDLEFVDQVDNRKKYCQVKAGPNTINKDDVETISNHFKAIKNLARTNRLNIGYSDLVVGILYGQEHELNANYKKLIRAYPVLIGKDFWHRLTGDEDFYLDLVDTFGEVAEETEAKEILEDVIAKLASEIEVEIIKKRNP